MKRYILIILINNSYYYNSRRIFFLRCQNENKISSAVNAVIQNKALIIRKL